MAGNAHRAVTAIVLLSAALGCAASARAEVNVAVPKDHVADEAHLLDAATYKKLDDYLTELENKTGAQVILLTLPTIEGEEIVSFAQRHFDRWKLGQKGKDNGAIIVLALKERRAWIHTGYGLEGALPDGWCGSAVRKVRDEYFRAGKYAEGLHDLVLAVANKVADEQGVKLEGVPEVRHREDRDSSATVILVLCVLGVVIWLYIQRRRYYRRVWRTGSLSQGGFWGSLLQEMARNSSSSNWSGGSFGGGFGGGSSGGGSFGGGGGGSSGGGGGGASW